MRDLPDEPELLSDDEIELAVGGATPEAIAALRRLGSNAVLLQATSHDASARTPPPRPFALSSGGERG